MPHSSSESSAAKSASRTKRFTAVGLLIALIALILDQAVKFLIESTMELDEKIEVIPGVLNIHYILNPGAAFSMGENFTVVFTVLQAVVAVFVLFLLFRRVMVRRWALALGALLGGVLGNLGDRLFREPSFGQGHVVDMISVNHFAIFNVADSFIVCSMIVIAYFMIRGLNLDGSTGDGPKTYSGDAAPDEQA